MENEIGAYEAKTKLPELLRQVLNGKRFTITNRGKPVAELVPVGSISKRNSAAAIDRYEAFMRLNPVKGRLNIKQLIREGRE
jgi:prevent-host-death family protein